MKTLEYVHALFLTIFMIILKSTIVFGLLLFISWVFNLGTIPLLFGYVQTIGIVLMVDGLYKNLDDNKKFVLDLDKEN